MAIESYIDYEIFENYVQEPKVSYSCDRIEKIIKYLADNLVTPISLKDVLDDLFMMNDSN